MQLDTTNRRRHAARLAILAALIVAALVLAACGDDGGDGGDAAPDEPTPTPLPGTVLDPPKPLNDFTLTAHTGEPLTLSDLRGQVVVIYFGYTNCPDICPTTFANYKRLKAALTEDEQAQLSVVFLSVDGERDTPERLAAYVAAFDPAFIGLTGDDADVRLVARDFGVFYQRQDYSNETNYLVDHTASTFVVGPEGQLRIVYPHGTDPAIMAQGVSRLMASG